MKKLDKIKLLSLSAEAKCEIVLAGNFLEYCKINHPEIIYEFESSLQNSEKSTKKGNDK